MQVNLNLAHIEHYAPFSNEEIDKNLKELEAFIEQVHKPLVDAEKISSLDVIYHIAQDAFKRFDFLSFDLQKKIFDIFRCFSRQKETPHATSLEHYNKFVYLWTHLDYFSTAFSHIHSFLCNPTQSANPNGLIRAISMTKFAIKHFDYLEGINKAVLKNLATLIKDLSSLNILLEANLPKTSLKRFERIRKYLDQVKVSSLSLVTTPLSQPPLTKPLYILEENSYNTPHSKPKKDLDIKQLFKTIKQALKIEHPTLDFEEDCVIVRTNNQFTKEETLAIDTRIEKEMQLLFETEENQLKKICCLCKDLFKLSLPITGLTVEYQNAFMEQFDAFFPLVAKQLFFHTPEHASGLEFKLINNLLNQFDAFLTTIIKKHEISAPLSASEIQERLTTVLNHLFTGQDKSPVKQFLAIFGVTFCRQLINQLLVPEKIDFILDRFFGTALDLEDFQGKPIPIHLFETDSKITEELEKNFKGLANTLTHLGDLQWGSNNLIISVLLKIFNFNRNALAGKIQQAIHQIKSSTCSMKPLLFLHYLLLNKEESETSLSWLAWQALSVEQKQKSKTDMELKFKVSLFKFLEQKVKEYQTLGLGSLALRVSSLQTFCYLFGDRLFKIIHNEDCLKSLLVYLLEGVEKTYYPSK